MWSISRKNALFFLVLFFIASRLTLFALEADNYLYKLPNQDDAPVYLNTARVYLGQGTYEDYNLSPFTRTPIYPLFLAFFLSWPQYTVPAILITQQAIGLLIVLTVFLFITKHHDNIIAFFISLALISFFDFCLYGFLVRNELIFSVLILYATICYLQIFQSPRFIWSALSGLIFGVSTLTRPVSFLIFIPLFLPFLFSMNSSLFSLRRALIHYTIFFIAFFLPITPWLIHNYQLTHHFVLQLETSLVHATFPGGHYQAYDVENFIDTTNKNSLEIDQSLFSLALHRIKTEPKIWLTNTWQNFSWRLWSMGFTDTYLRYFGHIPDNGGYQKTSVPLLSLWLRSINLFSPDISINPFYHIYLILNNLLGFAMIGLSLLALVLTPFFSTRNKIIFLVIFYYWLITSFFQFSGSRLILPVVPLLLLLLPDLYLSLLHFLHRSPQPPHHHR